MFVFVYGTLKKDEPNYHWLTNEENGTAKFVSAGKTCMKYPLVISSRYNIPFLLNSPGLGKNIYGEIYQVDDKMLSNLDILEECPKLYIRRQERITKISSESNDESNEIIEAWTYFLPDFKMEMLQLEMLEKYSTHDGHNKPYIARYIRDKEVDHRKEVRQSDA